MRRVFAAAVLLSTLMLAGCPVGLLSKTETFSGTDTFSIASPRSDILDVIAGVGKDMGMSVTSIDKQRGAIALAGQGSSVGVFVGAGSGSTLTIEVKDGGKTLQIASGIWGNFGKGNQDAATKFIEDFKSRLAKKLGQGEAIK